MKMFTLHLCMGVGAFVISIPFVANVQSVISDSEITHSVCSVTTNSITYDNHEIVVEGTVVGDIHSTVLEGSECGRGMYMVHSYGRPGDKWKAFDDAVAAKSSGLDKRILYVKVRGVYHNALPDGPRNIRQLEVTEVLDVRFGSSRPQTR
jgi:hypothetical protein